MSPLSPQGVPVSLPPPSYDGANLPSLRPNLAIILVGLGFTFMLVCAFALFAKCMNPHFQRRREPGWNLDLENPAGAHKDGPGVDPSVINALPLVFYKRRNSCLKRSGSTADLEKALGSSKSRYQELESECAVCLSVFEEGEQLRQLPECRHAFHPDCVDSWLGSHPSCPLCRRSILSSEDKVAAAAATAVPQESQRLRIGELSDAASASRAGDADAAAATVASPPHLPEIIVIEDESGQRTPSPEHFPAVGENAASPLAARPGNQEQVGVWRQADNSQEQSVIAAVPVIQSNLTEGLQGEGTNPFLPSVTSASPKHTGAA